MNRRTLLATVGVTTAGLAGCLGSVSGEQKYEECDAPFVLYGYLPDDVATEVDSAFENGGYETDDELLYAQAVSDDTPLGKDDTLYEHQVEPDGDAPRLSFEEWTAYSSPVELTVRNDTDDAVELSVAVTDDNGTVVLAEDAVTVDPDGGSRSFPVASAFGEYDIDIEFENGRRETETWYVGPPTETSRNFGGTVRISDGDVSFRQDTREYDRPICPWE